MSLVGHIQLRNDTLVSGGSDGTIRIWSLFKIAPLHRIAAADNSITGVEFDHNRILSGASDGRVRVWNMATGAMVRELGEMADAVWRVSMYKYSIRSNRSLYDTEGPRGKQTKSHLYKRRLIDAI
jgi:F-box and WD-40 domain protein CDC4